MKIICRPALAFYRMAGANFTDLAVIFGIGKTRAASEVRAWGLPVRTQQGGPLKAVDTKALDIPAMVAAYAAGETTTSLAARFKVDQRTAAKYLKLGGAKMRHRGRKPINRAALLSDDWGSLIIDDELLIRRRIEDGKTLKELADEFGCSAMGVHGRLRRLRVRHVMSKAQT